MPRVYELPQGTAIDLDQLFAVGPVTGHTYWDVCFMLTFLAWTGPVRNPHDYPVRISDHLVFKGRTDWHLPMEDDRARDSRLLRSVREYAEQARRNLIAAWGGPAAVSDQQPSIIDLTEGMAP